MACNMFFYSIWRSIRLCGSLWAFYLWTDAPVCRVIINVCANACTYDWLPVCLCPIQYSTINVRLCSRLQLRRHTCDFFIANPHFFIIEIISLTAGRVSYVEVVIAYVAVNSMMTEFNYGNIWSKISSKHLSINIVTKP